MERIVSADNALLKSVRRLGTSARERNRTGKLLLDGVHLVQAYAQRHGCAHATIVVSESGLSNPEIATAAVNSGAARVVCVADSLFARISPVQTPSGILTVVDRPQLEESGDEAFWVVLDGLQDPGNLGSILRTAAASGATCAVLAADCADPWSPKALRGGMGAQLTLPLQEHASLGAVLKSFHGRVIGMVPRGGPTIFEVELRGPIALVFGSEGHGLRPDTAAGIQLQASIPASGAVESLNVAAAAAVCCFERVRQRSAGGDSPP
ncbi:MAG: RNA methyltransferase [Burkholderiales bacterium]